MQLPRAALVTARASAKLPLQRRIERLATRYQARLEAGVGDRWIPNVFSVGLAAVLIYLGLARIDSLRSGVDLAGYAQAVWLIAEGESAEPSLFGSGVHVLELHWSFVMYPLALGAVFGSAAKFLVIVQGIALGVAVVPLWRLARNVAKLRIGAASALILAYGLHPATHSLGIEDFHPVSLAVPALIAMAYFGATKRWTWYWLCVVFVLLCRADIGLAVALWGLINVGRTNRRVGLWSIGIGLVWSLGFLLVAQPIMGQPGPRGGYGGQSLGEIFFAVLRDPYDVFTNLVSAQNVELIIALMAPLIFLPLLSIRHLSAGVFVAMFSLVVESSEQISFAEQSGVLLAFSVISATFALKRLGNMGVDRTFLDSRLLTAVVAAAVLLYSNGSPISPYERPWEWNDGSAHQTAVIEAASQVQPGEAVRASPSALTQLSQRNSIFELETDGELSVTRTASPNFVDAVLLVDRDLPPQTLDQRMSFDEGMRSLGFVLRFEDGENGVRLYVR